MGYSNETFSAGTEVEDPGTGLALSTMHAMNQVGETLVQSKLGRLRYAKEHVITRKLGQKGWCLTKRLAGTMGADHDVYLVEVDMATMTGSLVDTVKWADLIAWPKFPYGGIGSYIAKPPVTTGGGEANANR